LENYLFGRYHAQRQLHKMINIPKFIKSIGHAIEGIITLVKSENNARIHLLATLLVILVCFYVNISASDWRWIILAITLVWICEAINSAIEALVDLASPALHPLAKRAKDIAAGAVLLATFFALFVAVNIFVFK
jgi:diacylglycerol kinase